MRRSARVRTPIALPVRGVEQPRARRLARAFPRVLRGRAPARHAGDRPLRARVPLPGARRVPRALPHALGGRVRGPRECARARAQGRARAARAGADLAGAGGGVPGPVRRANPSRRPSAPSRRSPLHQTTGARPPRAKRVRGRARRCPAPPRSAPVMRRAFSLAGGERFFWLGERGSARRALAELWDSRATGLPPLGAPHSIFPPPPNHRPRAVPCPPTNRPRATPLGRALDAGALDPTQAPRARARSERKVSRSEPKASEDHQVGERSRKVASGSRRLRRPSHACRAPGTGSAGRVTRPASRSASALATSSSRYSASISASRSSRPAR